MAPLLACLLLSACGGSSPSQSASSERSRERADEAKAAAFAKCLREHGVHAETVSGPNGSHGLKIQGAGSGPQSLEGPQKACARYRPEPKQVNLSPLQKAEVGERLQRFAKCMREHGIKVEVSTQGGAVRVGIHNHAGAGAPNPESPGFQRAQNACQKLMPMPPGVGGSGPLKSTSKAAPGAGNSLVLGGG